MNKSNRDVLVVVIGMMGLGAILFFPQPPLPPVPPIPPDGNGDNGWIGTNFAPMEVWDVGTYWAPSYWDTSVTHNGNPSWRNTGTADNKQREMNADWVAVNPGDHIVLSAWMKTNPSVIDQEPPNGENRGCRIGFDWYANGPIKAPNGYTQGVCHNPEGGFPTYPQPTAKVNENYVPWGSDWTYREIDCIVPATVEGVVPWGIICWWGVPWYVHGETATVWISELTLYINPQAS